MQSKKNLEKALYSVFLLTAVAFCAKSSCADENDIDSSLLEIVEMNNKALHQKESSMTPKDRLLESVIRTKTQEAIIYRNYVAPEDPNLLDMKRSVNIVNAREHGEEILAERRNGGFKKKKSQNLEQGLMSSFDKKKKDKKKYKVLDKNKESGDSSLYKDQATSVSDAFKKLK